MYLTEKDKEKEKEKPKSVYVTFDEIRPDTGQGLVTLHEVQALKATTNLVQVTARTCIDIQPTFFKKLDLSKYYPFIPYIYDYFAAITLPDVELDLIHLNCSPASAILDRVKVKHSVCNITAHDLKESIDEHERLYGPGTYPYIHNIDPMLHEALNKHAKRADVVITASKASALWIIQNIKPHQVKIIPHGVDLPKEVKPLPEQFRVGYLGAFGPDKGLIYLIMAWSHLDLKDGECAFGGDCSVPIKDAGKPIEPWLYAFSSKPSNYTLPGRFDNVSDFFNKLMVYVQPSVTEGFGIPVLEAMANGRPVIVSKGAGSSDLVEDGVEGFVVPPRDAKALADKIQYFHDHQDEAKKMGKNARDKAEKYSWEKVEKMYSELYREVLES